MDKQNCILQELIEKYDEWFDMAGDRSPALMINILVNKLIEERSKCDYYEKLLKAVRNL